MMCNGGIKKLRNQGIHVNYQPELFNKREKLLSIINEYDGLIVRNQTVVDEEVIHSGKSLKVIGRLGVGLDNIALEVLEKEQIKVVAAKNANATSVAEYVLAAMLDSTKHLSKANDDVKQMNWNRQEFIGNELKGKTLGLLGLGEIAYRVAERAAAFNMRIIGYDPFVSKYDFIIDEMGVELLKTNDELLQRADFISIHVPLIPQTKNLIDKKSLKKVRNNGIIINTSRGGIINEKDLYYAAKKGEIGGAYLDVLEKEPIDYNHCLLETDRVRITPHIAGITKESQNRISSLIATEVTNVLMGRKSLYTI